MAPPPPDGSRGCVATIRRLMQGVGHTVPCNTSRQAALQARWVGWVGTHGTDASDPVHTPAAAAGSVVEGAI